MLDDKYLYFRQIFNVITSLFSGCVSICVSSHAQPPRRMKIRLWRMGHSGSKETKWVLFSISTDSNISVTVCNSKPCVLREAGQELSLSIIWNISFCSCNERECDVEISSSSQMTGWKEMRWRWRIQDKQGVRISIMELKITREFYSLHSITFHQT